MIAILFTLTLGHQNEFIHCQKAKVRITVLPIMGEKTQWNSQLVLLACTYRLRELTCEWFHNTKSTDYQPLFPTQVEWTIVNYVMEVLRPFRYWALWMSRRHTVTLHHVIRVDNDMFDHLDGVMGALAKKHTPWKDDLFFAEKFARQKLSKYHAGVTPTTGMLLISAYILNHVRKFRLFRNWDKGMDIIPENETYYTTHFHEAFLMYVGN